MSKQVLTTGLAWISAECPSDDSEKSQLTWLLAETMDEESVIYNWPMRVVEKAAIKVSSQNASGIPERFFPLLPTDTKPVLCDVILPLIYPLLAIYGVMLLGNAGVGKTPFVSARVQHLDRLDGGAVKCLTVSLPGAAGPGVCVSGRPNALPVRDR